MKHKINNKKSEFQKLKRKKIKSKNLFEINYSHF